MSTNEPTSGQRPNPASDSGTTSGSITGDEEKGSPPVLGDAFLVEWDGDNDPLNPRSMSVLKKWAIVAVVATGSLLV
jgi:hypothetical protein